jgi:hypothetical protein
MLCLRDDATIYSKEHEYGISLPRRLGAQSIQDRVDEGYKITEIFIKTNTKPWLIRSVEDDKAVYGNCIEFTSSNTIKFTKHARLEHVQRSLIRNLLTGSSLLEIGKCDSLDLNLECSFTGELELPDGILRTFRQTATLALRLSLNPLQLPRAPQACLEDKKAKIEDKGHSARTPRVVVWKGNWQPGSNVLWK